MLHFGCNTYCNNYSCPIWAGQGKSATKRGEAVFGLVVLLESLNIALGCHAEYPGEMSGGSPYG